MQNTFVIEKINHFSIEDIAESGQTFRWNKDSEGIYTGVAYGRVISIKEEKDKIFFIGVSENEYQKIWKEYFDLDRDYSGILSELRGKDKYLNSAIEYADGIRILNQEVWEMVISFIISGNNNIPRIKNSIKMIAERFGNFIVEKNGEKYYSFPSPKELSVATIEDLRACGVGYRDKYIYNTTKAINDEVIYLNKLMNMDIASARIELKKLSGIGDKIADCVLLFSCKKDEAFPIDTWVKKILLEYYGIKSKKIEEINDFAKAYFGEYCGMAQQYLFHYIRNNNKK